MADVETAVGEAAIERVMAIFEKMKNPAPGPGAGSEGCHGFHLCPNRGELDEKRFVVAGLTRLKTLSAPAVLRNEDHGA